MNTEYVQQPTLAKYTVNMSNTLPGTYVKNHPSLPIYQKIRDFHMYPQMTLPRTVLWNYKVCSLVTKIMPPDLLGENFTPSENSDSPGFPIFHNFKSKENLL
jgi:hypothetical protein